MSAPEHEYKPQRVTRSEIDVKIVLLSPYVRKPDDMTLEEGTAMVRDAWLRRVAWLLPDGLIFRSLDVQVELTEEDL